MSPVHNTPLGNILDRNIETITDALFFHPLTENQAFDFDLDLGVGTGASTAMALIL